MTASGSYTFFQSNASMALQAYSRLQIRRTALLAEHMADAYQEMNLMLSSWSNLQPNLWTVDLITVPLVQGTTTYSVDPATVMILDAYLSYGSPTRDRLIFPISRTDYASYPDKTVQNQPTVFWFDRLESPTITLWPVPDGNGPYVLKYYRCKQVQDANLQSGETPEVPYRWLDAGVAGLAHRLSRIWKPELEQIRSADADAAWKIAATQDIENTPMYISPVISGYYRN